MNIKGTLEQIEARMATNQATIDATNAKIAPIQAELDAINAEIQVLQAKAFEKAAQIEAIWGPNWVTFKRNHGILASTRMQLRQALQTLGD